MINSCPGGSGKGDLCSSHPQMRVCPSYWAARSSSSCMHHQTLSSANVLVPEPVKKQSAHEGIDIFLGSVFSLAYLNSSSLFLQGKSDLHSGSHAHAAGWWALILTPQLRLFLCSFHNQSSAWAVTDIFTHLFIVAQLLRVEHDFCNEDWKLNTPSNLYSHETLQMKTFSSDIIIKVNFKCEEHSEKKKKQVSKTWRTASSLEWLLTGTVTAVLSLSFRGPWGRSLGGASFP